MKTIGRADEKDYLTLISLAQEYADEDKARGLLESMRWPKGPVCPHCQNTGNAAKGVVALTKWLMAMFIICSSKKSISANQLHRMLKVQYKTAWFMAHRIRSKRIRC